MKEPLWLRAWRQALAVAPLLAAFLMIGAVFYSAEQARCSREALELLSRQSLTAGMHEMVKSVVDKPDLVKKNTLLFKDLPREKVQALLLADTFLTEYEQVITNKGHIPESEYNLYQNSMGRFFREIPVLHEWMHKIPDMWSAELWAIERANQPKDQPRSPSTTDTSPPQDGFPILPSVRSDEAVPIPPDSRPRYSRFGPFVDLAQLVLMGAAVFALFLTAKQARAAKDSITSLALQGLTDTAIAGIRDMMMNPALAKDNHVGFSGESDERIQAYMLADIWCLHWENVLAQQRHLPKKTAQKYRDAMGYLFQRVPILHEWLNMTRKMWCEELLNIAAANPVMQEPNSPKKKTKGDSRK